jgi:hypothetical protein
MKIQIDNAKKIGEGIWEASLKPSEIRMLGPCSNSYLETSVLMIEELTMGNGSSGDVLTIDHSLIHVLNIGNSSRTLILEEKKTNSIVEDVSPAVNASITDKKQYAYGGDTKFARALPDSLKELGQNLLNQIRQHFSGSLNYTECGKFVESPKNFWTVKIQPRDVSLAMTVKGRPETFAKTRSIELKDDRPGYSRFKLIKKEQLSEAVDIIKQASKK